MTSGPGRAEGPPGAPSHWVHLAMSLLYPSNRLCTPCPPRKLLGWGPAHGWLGRLARKNGKMGKIEMGLGGHFWYPYVSVPIQIGPYRLWHTLRMYRILYGEFRKCRILKRTRRVPSEFGFLVFEKIWGLVGVVVGGDGVELGGSSHIFGTDPYGYLRATLGPYRGSNFVADLPDPIFYMNSDTK